MPKSRAIWVMLLPLVSASCTASRLHSCVKTRCSFFAIACFPLGRSIFHLPWLYQIGGGSACDASSKKRKESLSWLSLQQLGACGRGKVSRPIINSGITSCDGEQGA